MMLLTIFPFLWMSLLAVAEANISFPAPYIECPKSVLQCLRGMECVNEL